MPAHGFLLNNRGEFRAVDFPGHINTIPQRILPDGTILGCYHDTDTMGTMHGMSYSRRGWDAIPEGMSMHNGATPNGKLIVGLFTDMDNRGKGYFVDRGRFIAFEVPGAVQTAAWDINPAGVAVGVYRDAAGNPTVSSTTASPSAVLTCRVRRPPGSSGSAQTVTWSAPTSILVGARTDFWRSGLTPSNKGESSTDQTRPSAAREAITWSTRTCTPAISTPTM